MHTSRLLFPTLCLVRLALRTLGIVSLPWDCWQGKTNEWSRVFFLQIARFTEFDWTCFCLFVVAFFTMSLSLVRARHTPRQSLHNHPLGHVGVEVGVGVGGGGRRGRQRKCWMDNVKERASLPMPEVFTITFRRKDWKRISADLSFVSPGRPYGRGTDLNT